MAHRSPRELIELYWDEVLLADDTYVTSVWNMHTRNVAVLRDLGVV